MNPPHVSIPKRPEEAEDENLPWMGTPLKAVQHTDALPAQSPATEIAAQTFEGHRNNRTRSWAATIFSPARIPRTHCRTLASCFCPALEQLATIQSNDTSRQGKPGPDQYPPSVQRYASNIARSLWNGSIAPRWPLSGYPEAQAALTWPPCKRPRPYPRCNPPFELAAPRRYHTRAPPTAVLEASPRDRSEPAATKFSGRQRSPGSQAPPAGASPALRECRTHGAPDGAAEVEFLGRSCPPPGPKICSS